MSVGQMNDEDASIGSLVVTMVAVEESCLIWSFVGPEILEVLAHHMLAMTGMIEGDLFTNATNETHGAVGGAVFAMGGCSTATTAVERRCRGRQELLHVGLVVQKMLLHGHGLCLEDGGTAPRQHLFIHFVDFDGNEDIE